MGMGLKTNLYNIGGDPLTQLIFLIFFNLINSIFYFLFFKRNVDSEKMNGKYFVGDPLMQSIEHSSNPA